jgi:integrase
MKNANGLGTIFHNKQRKRYEVRVTIEGRRRKLVGKTQDEAWARARELQAQPITAEHTVETWLKEWLAGVDHLAPATMDNYRSMIRNHIGPAIGSVPLAELKPLHVRQMLNGMKENGKSANTRRLAKATLRRGLREAVDMELLARNVAAYRGPEGHANTKPGRSLTVEQVRQLQEAIDTNEIGPLVFLLVSTGLRRGEALALRWSDIDLTHGTLTVKRSLKTASGTTVVGATKTRGSRRTVDLPCETTEVLRKLGPGDGYLFTSRRGNPLDPPGVTRRVKAFTKQVLGEEWGPHEMRHSCASLLVSNGVPLKVVSDLLGHSSITLTANVYAHLAPSARAETARAFSGMLATTNEPRPLWKAS